MAILEISVVPVGTKDTGLSDYISELIKTLTAYKDIRYELTAMGTIIEGDITRLFSVAQMMHEKMFALGPKRVLTTLKIDDRRDKVETIRRKVKVVMDKVKL
ncbi:MAG: MTH1187 family thiamine-binding protein [Candidatus Omnitrophica bacterium]|nr:MTH1187 family thiamine-binding protein [Candidatus Omnitrophota bacterium]